MVEMISGDTNVVYGAITGLELDRESVELAPGIILRPTIAEIFSAVMLAYGLPQPGKPHPGPWAALQGGMALKARIQLEVNLADVPKGMDHRTVAWLVTALIRLHVDGPIRLAAVSPHPYSPEHAKLHVGELYEGSPHHWGIFKPGEHFVALAESNYTWLRRQLPRTFVLWETERFRRAFSVFDEARFSASSESSVSMIWTALEVLLGLSTSRDKGRMMAKALSEFVAAPDEADRARDMVRDLYTKRGSIIHAAGKATSRDHIQLIRIATVAFQQCVVIGMPDDGSA